jgi:YD repeat-containing protein
MPARMKTIAISLVALFVVSASCKKDSDAGGDLNSAQKLRTYTKDILAIGGRTVETYNINYDAEGRLTSLVSVSRPGYRMEYTYHNNDRFTYEEIDGDKVIIHKTYFLNSNSLVDSTYQYNHLNDTISFKYLYDEDKRLVMQKEYMYHYLISYPVLVNTTKYLYDLKGTLTKIQETYAETTFRYDSIHNNTVQLEPSYFPFIDKLPTHTYATRHGRTIQIEHTYLYDDRKRLIQERAAESDGRVTVRTYTYQ